MDASFFMEIINYGVIEGQRDTDYVAGTLPYEVRLETGDWRPYLPPGERQWSANGDSMSCVTFSALNSIETQEKFLTGEQPNYSDRWTAKQSGTTPQGNTLWQVADTIRKQGLVLDADYPTPPTFTWAEFHADINPDLNKNLLAKGQIWLQNFSISYEWVPVNKDAFLKALKQAPLQIVIPGHAILGCYCDGDVEYYFDTYEPYLKSVGLSGITSALKIVLTKNQMVKKFLIKDGDKIGVLVSEGFTFGGGYAKDMDALQKLKDAFEFTGNEPTINFPQ